MKLRTGKITCVDGVKLPYNPRNFFIYQNAFKIQEITILCFIIIHLLSFNFFSFNQSFRYKHEFHKNFCFLQKTPTHIYLYIFI